MPYLIRSRPPKGGVAVRFAAMRAGSGACGAVKTDLHLGRLSQTAARVPKGREPWSGPSVRHYDRSGVSCPWGWEFSRRTFATRCANGAALSAEEAAFRGEFPWKRGT